MKQKTKGVGGCPIIATRTSKYTQFKLSEVGVSLDSSPPKLPNKEDSDRNIILIGN